MSRRRVGFAAIAKRHGLALANVVKLPAQGVANHVSALGERLVLRIARPAPEFVADLGKEAVVIPAVVRLGVRTPALVDFDDSPLSASSWLLFCPVRGARCRHSASYAALSRSTRAGSRPKASAAPRASA